MNQRNTLSVLLIAAIAAVVAGTALAGAPQADEAARSEHPGSKLDANNDGAIDRSEAAAHPRLAAKFDELDRNRDGKLDASERPSHKGGHGRRGGHGGIDRVVSADADGDGRISRGEAASLPWLSETFDQIDRNRDGFVVRSELQGYRERMHAQRETERAKGAEERFVAADLNRDGKLSKLEVSEKMPQLGKAFAFMDEDRDGFLTRDDLKHSPRH